MTRIRSFQEFKNVLQDVFDRNERSLERFGRTHSHQPKVYLIESNIPITQANSLLGPWEPIDSDGWYQSQSSAADQPIFLDASHSRVWRLVSLLPAKESDHIVREWIGQNLGLDHCWLSRSQLLTWDGVSGWSRRGMGIGFEDGLAGEEESSKFSLKAWMGAREPLPQLGDLLERARETFAIRSVRWQQREGGTSVLTAEAYSNGKITFNSADDVDKALNFSSRLAWEYADSLEEAETFRDETLAPFEFEFSQEIDLDAFSSVVSAGLLPMRLWLTEVEEEEDFRRFRGVDMHTWDRIHLDLGLKYAHLSIPSKGCVNAAPRMATLQGEDNAGRTRVYHDGVEIFA